MKTNNSARRTLLHSLLLGVAGGALYFMLLHLTLGESIRNNVEKQEATTNPLSIATGVIDFWKISFEQH